MDRRSWPVRDIAEIPEHWQAGRDNTAIARSLGVDRKTARKYVAAARVHTEVSPRAGQVIYSDMGYAAVLLGSIVFLANVVETVPAPPWSR